MRFVSFFLVIAVFVCGAAAAVADVVDNGPPYTPEQFLEIAKERMPNDFRQRLPEWWARAPEYLRKRILNTRSEMWWPIILCNYFGFKPEGMGPGGAEKCEREAYEASQRGKSMWTADGQWIGPSEECRKRDKRSKWGELICD